MVLPSRPTRARGLKLRTRDTEGRHEGSRPTRARGLKHGVGQDRRDADTVAPHAGAWIETGNSYEWQKWRAGRAPRGRVD